MITVKHISLVKQDLGDKVLDKLYDRCERLESLDISFNNFTPTGLAKFVRKLSDSDMNLKSLTLAGNPLNVHFLEQNTLNETFRSLVTKSPM